MRLLSSVGPTTLLVACLMIAACGGDNSANSQSSASTVTGVGSVVKASVAGAASPSGTTIPSATQITDSTSSLWTVSSGVIYKNGALAGYSSDVTLLLYDNNVIYQENAAGGWWSWDGSTWVASSDPPAVGGACGTTNGMEVKTKPVANLCSTGAASTVNGTGPWTWSCAGFNGGKAASCAATLATPVVTPSPSGTTIPSATQIIDSSDSLWTVSGGIVYKNGALAGYSSGVTLLLYDNNIIYQENAAGGWWSWNGSTWLSSSDPRIVPVNGTCGSTNGMAVKTTPVANLCSTGSASSASGSGPWTWACSGSNGGTTASCSATVAASAVVTSASGTTIPSATQIIDGSDSVWTLSGGVVYKNGALAAYTKDVALLLFDNNIIYQENTSGGWWSWNGSNWAESSDPRIATVKPVAPTISGSPPTTDLAGLAYNFVPTTTNPSGGTLSFSITNKPAWASFSTTTGALTGTPSSAQAAVYSGIVISVSNGAAASLAAFSITVSMGSANLSWTAPTQNTNGTPLTSLAGYTIYYGTSSGDMTQTIEVANPGATSYVVGNLTAGTYYFTIEAYTSQGLQSAPSSTVSGSIQ